MFNRDEALIRYARETLRPLLLANPTREVGGVFAFVRGQYHLFDQIHSGTRNVIYFPQSAVQKACALDGALFHTHPESGCPISKCRYSAPSGFNLKLTLMASYNIGSPLVQVIVDPNGLFIVRISAAFVSELRSGGIEKAREDMDYVEWHGNRLAYMLAETESGLKEHARNFYDEDDMHLLKWLESIDAYVNEFNSFFDDTLTVSFDPL